ncbi:hypothetical protein CCR85_10985 [Rhodothalassium salexigens]|nr:hypothetical protein [Rhodothalassium salexigens]MBK5922171.1 hypothetical protein [Rhodothalassium salexigens]
MLGRSGDAAEAWAGGVGRGLVQRDDDKPGGAGNDAVVALLAQSLGADAITDKARGKLEGLAYWLIESLPEAARGSLADELGRLPSLSPDLARRLALDDSPRVAARFILETGALGDDDWIGLLDRVQGAAQVAMARRESVSAALAEALAAGGSRRAVAALVDNAGAALSSRAARSVLDRYGDDVEMVKGLALRDDLSRATVERVTAARRKLKARFERLPDAPSPPSDDAVAPDTVPQNAAAVDTAKEEALLARLDQFAPETLPDFIQRMFAGGRITDRFLLAAVKRGAERVLALALSARMRVNLPLVRARLDSGDRDALADLFDRAGVAATLAPLLLDMLAPAPEGSASDETDAAKPGGCGEGADAAPSGPSASTGGGAVDDGATPTRGQRGHDTPDLWAPGAAGDAVEDRDAPSGRSLGGAGRRAAGTSFG